MTISNTKCKHSNRPHTGGKLEFPEYVISTTCPGHLGVTFPLHFVVEIHEILE